MKVNILILFFISLINSCAFFGPSTVANMPLNIHAFKSDGCSAFPNGRAQTQSNEWLHCCIVHDLQYWMGGTKTQRAEADDEFKQCVETSTNKTQALLMKVGVRIGGRPRTGLPWRWGYGWNLEVPYFELEDIHRRSIIKHLSSFESEEKRWAKEMTPEQTQYIDNFFKKTILKISSQI